MGLNTLFNNCIKNGGDVFRSKYVNPFDADYRAYGEHLEAYNKEIQNRLTSFLLNECPESKDFTICLTGSDARLEKGPVSLAEFLIFYNGDFGLNNFDRCKEDLARSVAKSELFRFIEAVELKPVSDKQKLLCYCEMKDSEGNLISFPSPNRIFDSQPIYGDIETYQIAREKFLDEIKSSEGKSLLKKIKARVKSHVDVSLSGIQNYKGENITHFDWDKGLSFYDRNKSQSFKQGPLRTVQFSLVRDQIKAIREGDNSILDLPKSTLGKLNTILVKGNTTLEDKDLFSLIDSYKYFLWQYHCSQWASNREDKSFNLFDLIETKDKIESLVELCKKQIIIR